MRLRNWQYFVDKAWPVALLVMVIFTPFAVKKAFDLKKGEMK